MKDKWLSQHVTQAILPLKDIIMLIRTRIMIWLDVLAPIMSCKSLVNPNLTNVNFLGFILGSDRKEVTISVRLSVCDKVFFLHLSGSNLQAISQQSVRSQ